MLPKISLVYLANEHGQFFQLHKLLCKVIAILHYQLDCVAVE